MFNIERVGCQRLLAEDGHSLLQTRDGLLRMHAIRGRNHDAVDAEFQQRLDLLDTRCLRVSTSRIMHSSSVCVADRGHFDIGIARERIESLATNPPDADESQTRPTSMRKRLQPRKCAHACASLTIT